MSWFPWNRSSEPEPKREQQQFKQLLDSCSEETEEVEEPKEEVTENRCHPLFFDLDPHHSRR